MARSGLENRSLVVVPVIRVALVIAFIAGLIATVVPAAAQVSTPSAGEGFGNPVTIFNNNAQPMGEIIVQDIVDPFEDYDVASSEPTRGHHWAKVSVLLRAGDQAVSGGSFQMVDDTGFVTYQTYVSRSSESTTADPDFYASDVQPGQEVSGVVFFQVYNESSPALIEFMPASGQVVIAADLRESTARQGDVVSYASAGGAPIADVSVLGVLDPLEDFDPSSSPQRGFRYVGVAVSITNTGTRPFTTDPGRFSVSDREGFTYFSYGAYRTQDGELAFPSLQYAEVAPGSTVQGIVSFELINGATVAEVVFSPNNQRKFRLAEFAEGEALVPPKLAVVPTPTPVSTPDPACAELEAWVTEGDALFSPLDAVFDAIDEVQSSGTGDPAALRDDADQLRTAAGQIGDMDTPEIARAAADQFADILNRVADEIDVLADAVEADDAETITASLGRIFAILDETQTGAFADLATRCPDE